ncbi:MAG: hypothetical protein ACJ72W_06215 [Actinoallomurus sp.]
MAAEPNRHGFPPGPLDASAALPLRFQARYQRLVDILVTQKWRATSPA